MPQNDPLIPAPDESRKDRNVRRTHGPSSPVSPSDDRFRFRSPALGFAGGAAHAYQTSHPSPPSQGSSQPSPGTAYPPSASQNRQQSVRRDSFSSRSARHGPLIPTTTTTTTTGSAAASTVAGSAPSTTATSTSGSTNTSAMTTTTAGTSTSSFPPPTDSPTTTTTAATTTSPTPSRSHSRVSSSQKLFDEPSYRTEAGHRMEPLVSRYPLAGGSNTGSGPGPSGHPSAHTHNTPFLPNKQTHAQNTHAQNTHTTQTSPPLRPLPHSSQNTVKSSTHHQHQALPFHGQPSTPFQGPSSHAPPPHAPPSLGQASQGQSSQTLSHPTPGNPPQETSSSTPHAQSQGPSQGQGQAHPNQGQGPSGLRDHRHSSKRSHPSTLSPYPSLSTTHSPPPTHHTHSPAPSHGDRHTSPPSHLQSPGQSHLYSPPRQAPSQTPSTAPSSHGAAHSQPAHPAGRSLFPKTLPDLTQYATPIAPPERESSLEALAHIVRLSRYQERKRTHTRLRLQRSLISTALAHRYLGCADIAFRNLYDCYRHDDKKTFASLYNALHDVRQSCEELRRFALAEPAQLEAPESDADSTTLSAAAAAAHYWESTTTETSFFLRISDEARQTCIRFLEQIRNNPDYLAARLCSLSTSQLTALASFYQVSDPVDSVLPHQKKLGRSPAAAAGLSPRVPAHMTNPVERLLSFQRHDPLSAMLNSCFSNVVDPETTEEGRRRTEIWATVCARLINLRRTGNETVILAVLNVWSGLWEWTGRSNLEWFLLKLLDEGAFIMEKAETAQNPATGRMDVPNTSARLTVAATEFYEKAVQELLELIDDPEQTGIPQGFLLLATQIIRRIDSACLESTLSFFVIKWLFHNFLISAIIHPESHGMMRDYHISDVARQTILRQVAMRAMQYVVDLLTLPQNLDGDGVVAKVKAHIDNIIRRLQGLPRRPVPGSSDSLFPSPPSTTTPLSSPTATPVSSSSSSSSSSSAPQLTLRPAQMLRSLTESVQAHPYLVLSPVDFVTLVNAMFPEKRPRSPGSSHLPSTGAPSITAASSVSQRVADRHTNWGAHRYDFPAGRESVLSDSSATESTAGGGGGGGGNGSGVNGDDHPSKSSLLGTPPGDGEGESGASTPVTYEEDGIKLRMAMEEMTEVLGLEVVQGACHPCAEQWAVLFISPDGRSLSTSMLHESGSGGLADEDDGHTESSESESDDETVSYVGSTPSDGPQDREFRQVRDAILRLVEAYEVPHAPPSPTTPKAAAAAANKPPEKRFRTARTTALMSNDTTMSELGRADRVLNPPVASPAAALPSGHNNPYRSHIRADDEEAPESTLPTSTFTPTSTSTPTSASPSPTPTPAPEKSCLLVDMLQAAARQCFAQSNFVASQFYWQTLENLDKITAPSLRKNGFEALLNIFARGPRDVVRRSMAALDEYEAWLVWLKHSQEQHDRQMDRKTVQLQGLRDKMWYMAEVRHSQPFDYCRNICMALKAMDTARRRRARSANAAYLLQTESQIVELLAASNDQGGPNKLSDDQSEKTQRWLLESDIQVFCKGEERIHLFTLEIDNCISKLLGSTMMAGPVLWSSDLYQREKRWFESSSSNSSSGGGGGGGGSHHHGSKQAGRDRESTLGLDDTSSVLSEPERRYAHSLRTAMRTLAGPTASQLSACHDPAGSSRLHTLQRPGYGGAGAGASLSSILDSHEFFGPSSPIHAIDATNTYYSVFQATSSAPASVVASRSTYSPPGSVANFSTMTPGPGPILQLPHLSQTIMGRGGGGGMGGASPTAEAVQQQKRVEEKIRFLQNLQQTLTSLMLSELRTIVFAHGSETDVWFNDIGKACIELRTDPEVPVPPKEENPRRTQPSSDSRSSLVSGESFPFQKAYERLLRMFTLHPSPYGKLDCLHELRQLVAVAIQTPGCRRSRGTGRSSNHSHSSPPSLAGDGTTGSSSTASRSRHILSTNTNTNTTSMAADPIEESIDNLKERHAQTVQAGLVGSSSSGSVSGSTSRFAATSTAATEAIRNELLVLFRDSRIRPKTLFRDLQFIASFVPASVLDSPERGVAFWDTGIVSLSLKQDFGRIMLPIADKVVQAYTQLKRGRRAAAASAAAAGGDGLSGNNNNNASVSGGSASGNTAVGSDAGSDISRSDVSVQSEVACGFSLARIASIYVILAKEGEPVAQRELALMYLSNPELLERTMCPLSKPREVFQKKPLDGPGLLRNSSRFHRGSDASSASGGSGTNSGSAGGGNGSGSTASTGPEKDGRHVDGKALYIARHWMECAAQGGDPIAKNAIVNMQMR